MATWHLNPALTRFRDAVNAAYPNRDKASDGTIGDAAHQATASDHNPDPDGSVDAWDMDVDGVPVEHLKAVFQRHESSKYWIHAGQIASRDWGRRTYDGGNLHNHHVHWNTRSSHENSTAPWEVDVNLNDRVPWHGAAQRDRMVAAGYPAEGLLVRTLMTYTFEGARGRALDDEELAAVEAAAQAGATAGVLASVDTFVAVVEKLPTGSLTRDDVESAVRAVFADAGS
jgi:hypothetical protein